MLNIKHLSNVNVFGLKYLCIQNMRYQVSYCNKQVHYAKKAYFWR